MSRRRRRPQAGAVPLSPDDPLPAVVEQLTLRGRRLAVAESLTGGLVGLRITEAPGSGDVFVGTLVTYQSEAKRRLLGVPDGPVVSAACAQAMADGVAALFECTVAVSTTGVAGPETQDGQPVGTVFLGWHVEGRSGAARRQIDAGSPTAIREAACRAALTLLAALLTDSGADAGSETLTISQRGR